MNRRALLRATPLALLGVAGCLSSGGGSGGDPGNSTRSGPATGNGTPTETGASTGTAVRVRWDPGPEFERVSVGDRSDVPSPDRHRPISVLVWNDGGARRLAVTVRTGGGRTAVDETYDAPAAGLLAVELLAPDDYAIEVGVPDTGSATTFSLARADFDCNHRTERIAVRADGGIDRWTASTEMACGYPKIADASLGAEDGTCGGANAATVSFDGPTVVVDGSLAVPTPCHGADLSAATYDADADELRAVVAATAPPAGTACVQCTGTVPYQARVTFDGGLPGRVVVVHDGLGGRAEVASTRR
ncbi:MAG: hypothetical protein ABEJ28_01790 [Salinigranum sp.]